MDDVVACGRRMGASAILSLALGLSSELGWWTGRWAPAHADAVEALHWAEELDQVGLIGHVLSQLSRIEAARGDREWCEEQVQRARHEVEPRGVGCLAIYNAALGLCALSPGELATAIDHLERAWDAGQAGGLGNANVVPFAGDLAEALARAGAEKRAEQVLAWLQERADATGLVYALVAAAPARGILANDQVEAKTWFARARSAHHGSRCRSSRPARCSARERHCTAPTARRLPPTLRHALTICSGRGARPWAVRAMTELAATGARADTRNVTSTSALDSLSPQEP